MEAIKSQGHCSTPANTCSLVGGLDSRYALATDADGPDAAVEMESDAAGPDAAVEMESRGHRSPPANTPSPVGGENAESGSPHFTSVASNALQFA